MDPMTDTDQATPARPARSRLAVASAAMGLASLPLVCCGAGISGAVAVVLGMMAFERIRASGGALRGRGLAWTGIGSGLLTIALSVLFVAFADSMRRDWDAQLDDGLRATFAAHDDASALEALRHWSAASNESVSSREIAAFAAQVRGQLGELESIGIVSKDASPSMLGDMMMTHLITLDFAKGRRSGAVTARMQPSVEDWMPSLHLAAIHLNDPDAPGGTLSFPVKRESPSGGAAEAGADGKTDGETDGESKEAKP